MKLYNLRLLTSAGLSPTTTMDLPLVDADDRDASGLILSPGWVDLHAHLRDPGFPEKETLITGAASAAFGGFTQVVAMANTNPATDDAARLSTLVERAATLPVRVSFAGSVTRNLEGQELTDALALRAAGAVALSDDGRHAMDGATLRRALQAAAEAGLPVFIHGQREALGTTREAESQAVTEALEALTAVPKAHLHVQHVSTMEAIGLVAEAKRQGLQVTGEATPHHLSLTAQDGRRLGRQGNVSPPLRTPEDRDALREAVNSGVIDVIATDHAPHDAAAKAAGANGFHGFETAVGVVMGLGLDWAALHRATVQRPREIIYPLPVPPHTGEGGVSAEANAGDWILIDPELEWTVDPGSFRSRGKNTPLAGRRLKGRVVMTVCGNHVLFERMVQRV